MSDTLPTSNFNRLIKIVAAALGGLVITVFAGFMIYSSVCPCERTPGGFLFGERAAEPVTDWNFANDVALCQLQIYAGMRPHSINLNCMSTPQGELFLSCSTCEQKYWARQVGENETAVMRLNGIVYPVTLNRVTNPARLDAAWQARVSKLQTFGGAPVNPTPDPSAMRPGHWWSFQVQSAG
ncbi:MAG: hypothetical protein ACI95C_002037 [Pseudohongiellaceae bacterium]|jgi:hypothetical protein